METVFAVVIFILGLFVPSGDGNTSATIDSLHWYAETGEPGLYEYSDNIICYTLGEDWGCPQGDTIRRIVYR